MRRADVRGDLRLQAEDGTQARRYVCANVHTATATCDQPPLDAERIDTAVVAYLDSLFIDYEGFVEKLSRGRDRQRAALEGALDAALGELDQTDATAGKIEADYIRRVQADEDAAADVAARALDRVRGERRDAERRIEECRRRLAELDDRPHDAALDVFNKLKRAISGGEGEGLGELNEPLRAEFEEFRIDRMEDGVVGVLPVLRERPTPLNLGAAYREWEEAGMPDPTPEEIEGFEREIRTWPEVVSADKRILAPNLPPRSPALLLATARDTIRPPAKALTVPDRNLPDSQE